MTLLNRCQLDDDDEVRDRATMYVNILQKQMTLDAASEESSAKNTAEMALITDGLPEGVSGFLKVARILLPPDSVNVVDIAEIEDTILQVLTPKQLEIATLAVQSGYYENPRKISKKELSDLTQIPRSTLQEHLSKAEAAMIEWAVNTHLSK